MHFFILFCVFGFGGPLSDVYDGYWAADAGAVTSFGQLAIVYLAGPLKTYSKSQVA
jgi:hypothetical protein